MQVLSVLNLKLYDVRHFTSLHVSSGDTV